MNIKTAITELRATGLTQQALADLVPCSQSTINAYENGNRATRPSFSIVSKLLELHAERCCAASAPTATTTQIATTGEPHEHS
ncbi:helix-turn-helix domain-containing protein [Duganella sp. FT94W]|uniref:Helix-turn-helix domain-containing protein n=1 Tax=Duganella lactea TaxID=2692173 RepID=A0ABW9V821_9BURK|nr:helix-turn-helix transcriptional regulator [Duganella lactea]MYM34900.1 helix-turn-helix domain-containing protein [Duganella lactea]